MTEAELHRDLSAEQAWVRRLARLIAGDATLADDIAQDAWAVADRAPPERRRLWLGRVVRNLVRMRRRSATRRERYESVAEMPAVSRPDELVARMQAQRAVSGAVLALAEPYRSTVLMRFVEELSSADIARKLGIPESTVRRRLKVALDRLRAELSDDDGKRWLALLVVMRRPGAATSTTGMALAFVAIAVVAIVVETSHHARSSSPPSDLPALAAFVPPSGSTASPVPALAAGAAWSLGCESTMSGQVRDAIGPVAGARVSTAEHVVETDDAGHYAICMHPMRSVVRIDAPGYGALEDDRLHPTGDLDRDFNLVPESPITGRVADPSGAPIAGAQVVARADRSERHAALASGRAVTSVDGSFRIAGIAPGRFEVTATTRDRHAHAIVDSERIVDLVIDREAPVAAPLRAATITGRVTRHGKPAPGAEVWCLQTQAVATTAPDGSFILADVAPGRCLLAAIVDDASSEVQIVTVEAGERRRVEVEASHGGSIAGFVIDMHGEPVRGVYVMAMSADGEDGGDSITDARGAFTITTLGPGDYAMTVYPSLARGIAFPATAPHATVASEDSAVTGIHIAVDDRRVAIHGRIVDDTGAPLSDVYVEATHGPSSTPPSTRTALDGTFVISNVVPGSYAIRARAGDGRHGERADVVAGRGDLAVTLAR